MPFFQVDSIRYLVFDIFDGHNISHGVFTRHGGMSPEPWDTLNAGLTVGDDSSRVINNRKRIFNTFQLNNRNIFDVWQVHSSRVIRANAGSYKNIQIEQADAIVTNKPGLGLFMRFADCVPIFLYDPVNKAIGIAHAGWKGSVRGIAGKTVKHMESEFGSKPGDILAAIGPSICTEHYEVGPEVVEEVENSFGSEAASMLQETTEINREKRLFDLKKANKYSLTTAGVEQIEISPICTACSLTDWFSHRGENGRTGRFGALIVLTE
jgi:YfiH family protein